MIRRNRMGTPFVAPLVLVVAVGGCNLGGTPRRSPAARKAIATGSAPGPAAIAPEDLLIARTSRRPYTRREGFPGSVVIPFASRPTTMFERPWPSELDRKPDGRLEVGRVPLVDHPLLRPIVREIEASLVGYSVAPALLLPVEGLLGEEAVAEAIRTGAIQLLDVDPQSARRGSVYPLKHRIFRRATHVPDGTIGLRSPEVLAPNRLYALVVSRDWGSLQLGTEAEFERLKSTSPLPVAELEAQRELHEPVFDYLAEQEIPRESVAAIAMFRTQPAFEPLMATLEAVRSLAPAHRPKILDASWMPLLEGSSYRAVEGYYCTPSFQTGLEHAPFTSTGGLIERDRRDHPRPHAIAPSNPYATPECRQNMRARFVLAVPKGKPPSAGWPLAIYAHGTTGDARSVLSSFAAAAGRAGVAVVSTDQPLHGSGDPKGARPGSDRPFRIKFGPFSLPLSPRARGGELGFFNLTRPNVIRANVLQAVADSALLARLMLATDFAVATDARGRRLLARSPEGPNPSFASEFGYIAAGHSQGTHTAAALGAFDAMARATFLSAGGGDFASSMLERPDTQKALPLIELALDLAPDELDEFHPVVSLAQMQLDPTDPHAYASRFRRLDRVRNVLLVSGVGDTKMVDAAGAALARAMRLQPIGRLPLAIDGLEALGIRPAPAVQGNGPRGMSTQALLQLKPSYAYEPHFVAFREPVARSVLEEYLRALARGDTPPRLARGWSFKASPSSLATPGADD